MDTLITSMSADHMPLNEDAYRDDLEPSDRVVDGD